MLLDDAVEKLQNDIFEIEEAFWSELGGDVTAFYRVMVTDPETVLNELDINTADFETYSELHDAVEAGLYDCVGIGGGVDGVTPY